MIDKILVVDDDENWCFISKRMLRKASVGNEIITAKNGLEALTKLQQYAASGEKQPDLIFLDIKMPVMDGFEFLEEVSRLGNLNLSDTKIFICSSSLHPKDQERAAQHAVAGFINKPFTVDVLRDIMV
ncbi:response regulator [uncultured Pontibacter sp.]|uniref:response regulator n=1 Tax=uncultured Pontibacter sp. TaxID=453356 RepID=UPI0026072BCF|nr:response regulator [uncultured Pontibacter sp.]